MFNHPSYWFMLAVCLVVGICVTIGLRREQRTRRAAEKAMRDWRVYEDALTHDNRRYERRYQAIVSALSMRRLIRSPAYAHYTHQRQRELRKSYSDYRYSAWTLRFPRYVLHGIKTPNGYRLDPAIQSRYPARHYGDHRCA